MKKPILSVVVPVFNRVELTKVCLGTLQESLADIAHEVLVVDDCSSDGTREFLQTLTGNHRIHYCALKGCFSVSCNIGVALAQADTICFLNNDTVLPFGWHWPMLRALDQFEDVGLVGNVQRRIGTGTYDHFGICFPPWLTPLHYGQHLENRPAEGGAFSRWGAVTAACAMIRRDVFLSVGGFNPYYINGCEDLDLCLRLHQRGRWHYVAHDSEILHYKGASPGRRTHNVENLQRFKEQWGAYLHQHLVPRDAKLASRSYLKAVLRAPRTANLRKLIIAFHSLASRGAEKGLRNPEWFCYRAA